MRKRIVLSNTNALEVQGMRDYTADMVGKSDFEDAINTDGTPAMGLLPTVGEEGKGTGLVGKVVGLSGETVDCLRAAEAFKTTQSWGLFRRPGMLVRKESVKLGRWMVNAEEEKDTLRVVVDGNRGTGKSLMLVHALASASVRKWIVFNIPEGMFYHFPGLFRG